MSALCQKRTYAPQQKFLIRLVRRQVTSNTQGSLAQARLCGRQIDDELELCGLFDRQIRWFCALQYLVHICRAKPKEIGHAWAIRNQTACEYVFASCKYPGNSVAFKKVDDLGDLRIEYCVNSHDQRVGTLAQ